MLKICCSGTTTFFGMFILLAFDMFWGCKLDFPTSIGLGFEKKSDYMHH